MRKNLLFLLVIVAMILIGTGLAESGTKELTFAWEQDATSLPNLKEWRMKYAAQPGGPYTTLTTVPFDGTPKPEYQAQESVSLVPDGQKATLYFVATAVAKSGIESGPSNEISVDIDFTTVTVPIRFRLILN
jgi:hypothetical protein